MSKIVQVGTSWRVYIDGVFVESCATIQAADEVVEVCCQYSGEYLGVSCG